MGLRSWSGFLEGHPWRLKPATQHNRLRVEQSRTDNSTPSREACDTMRLLELAARPSFNQAPRPGQDRSKNIHPVSQHELVNDERSVDLPP
jgi:hypothetical protein